jgi:hypothetical protein
VVVELALLEQEVAAVVVIFVHQFQFVEIQLIL